MNLFNTLAAGLSSLAPRGSTGLELAAPKHPLTGRPMRYLVHNGFGNRKQRRMRASSRRSKPHRESEGQIEARADKAIRGRALYNRLFERIGVGLNL